MLDDRCVPVVVRQTRTSRVTSLLAPSLSDCLLIVFMLLLFSSAAGWALLLSDGDTGWHLRTGEYILNTHTVPRQDLFSFSKAGEPWFPWEWGADVILALAQRLAGLRGVVFLSGFVLGMAALTLFRYMMWRGAAVHVAVLIAILAVDASNIHFLARPHIFTLLLIPVSLWMIERDFRKPMRAIWLLIPIAALWTNLHGGFLVLISSLAIFAIVSGSLALLGNGDGDWNMRFRRYTILTVTCSLATLANPFGYHLHAHIAQYLQSDWIIRAIEEFQSPQFRSESIFKFEVLLFLGLCSIPGLLRGKQIPSAVLIMLWAHQALKSVRHVPIYAFISGPVIATELTTLWNRCTVGRARQSSLGAVRDLVSELGTHARRSSLWVPVFLVLLYVITPARNWPTDFPAPRFPVQLVSRNAARWTGGEAPRRILSSDAWGGYLIYHFYPEQKVFVDGRSDFYGSKLGNEYVCLRSACAESSALLDRYGVDSALIPVDWPLARMLRQDTRWRLVDEDKMAIWFERRTVRVRP